MQLMSVIATRASILLADPDPSPSAHPVDKDSDPALADPTSRSNSNSTQFRATSDPEEADRASHYPGGVGYSPRLVAQVG